MIVIPVLYRLYYRNPPNKTLLAYCYEQRGTWSRQGPDEKGGWTDTHTFDWDIGVAGTTMETYKKIVKKLGTGLVTDPTHFASVHGYIIDKMVVTGFDYYIHNPNQPWMPPKATRIVESWEGEPNMRYWVPSTQELINVRWPEAFAEEGMLIRNYYESSFMPVRLNLKNVTKYGLIYDRDVTIEGFEMTVQTACIDTDDGMVMRKGSSSTYKLPLYWREMSFGQLSRKVIDTMY